MKQKPVNTYAVYSGLGIQMAVVIGGCAWFGDYLDEKYDTSNPWFTIFLSLFGVAVSLYVAVKGFASQTK